MLVFERYRTFRATRAAVEQGMFDRLNDRFVRLHQAAEPNSPVVGPFGLPHQPIQYTFRYG